MIRLATVKDINGILELLHQVHEVHVQGRPDIFRNGTTKYTFDVLKQMLEEQKVLIYIYVEEDKVLGHAFCMVEEIKNNSNFIDTKYLFIDDICVDKDARRKNIGTKLYNFVKDYAKSIGCKSIRLNVWSFNESAYNFYKKMGMNDLETTMEEKI